MPELPAFYSDPSDLLSISELSARLKVRPSWIYSQTRRSCRGRSFPIHRVGKHLRFSWASVCEWLSEEQRGAQKKVRRGH
jgi:hypothetical protein